jgi:hypothetical protein
MQQALQYSAWAIGLWLILRVISVLVRGSYRQYPFVFAYLVTLLVSTVVEIGLQAAPQSVQDGYYWIDEVILDVLVFCVVIAFIDEAARHSKQKLIERHWLVLAAALICAVSFAIHHGLPMNRQMTLISRDLNICAVILDLILWSLLLTARRPNRRLMLLSGGLGLQLTGAIMGEQLRNLSHSLHSLLLTGQLLEVTTALLALYIWWRALRTAPAPKTAPA